MTKAEVSFYTRQALNTWKQNELNKYVLIAPSSGELQQVVSLTAGQLVQAGMKLAEISVDTTLLAICWIPPNDIGLIKQHMNATVRVNAFNANDWGFLQGQVSSVSSDAYMINNQPYFKVECLLNKDHLTLKNGFEGKLKKGMTLQASFQVATRSLYELLYDKMEDWLNPKLMS